jgi:hypothetical protein
MNKSQLLIELPSMLSHIVAKRGRVLRDGGSSGVSTLMKDKTKAWVATSVPSSANKLPWDEAHEVAAKLKKEFGSAVYVEPQATAGRFRQLTSPNSTPTEPDNMGSMPANPLLAATSAGPRGFGALAAGPGSMFAPTLNPMALGGDHKGGQAAFGLPAGGSDQLAGHMPQMPSIADFLPKEVADLLVQADKGSSGIELDWPAIRSAHGFVDLPTATQMMFEVEAAQLMNNGYQPQVGLDIIDEYSALVVLAMQPNISKVLRKFLDTATAGHEVAAINQEAANENLALPQ